MALLSVILFAASPSLARLSYLDGAGPLTAGVFRGALLCFVFCAPLIALVRQAIAVRPGEGREKIAIALRPALWLALSYAGFAWAYQQAILEIGAGIPLVAASAAAIPVVLAHAWKATGKAGAMDIIAAILTLAGVRLLAEDGDITLLGVILCLPTCFFCAAMTLATEQAAAAGLGAGQRSAIIGSGMLFLLIPILLHQETGPSCLETSFLTDACMGYVKPFFAFPITLMGWLAFLGSALTMIAAISLYSAAIGRMGAVRVALIANAEPALGLALAWLVAGEQLGWIGTLGGTLACAGLVDWRVLLARAARPPS